MGNNKEMKLNKSLKKVLAEMIKNSQHKTTLRLHTRKYIAEFEIKAISVEFKEKK